jgi:hypothetical protein
VKCTVGVTHVVTLQVVGNLCGKCWHECEIAWATFKPLRHTFIRLGESAGCKL